MDSNSVLWIVIAAVVAIAVIGVVVFFTRKAGNRRKQEQADQLRAEVEHDSARVNRQASLVEEAEAKAIALKRTGAEDARLEHVLGPALVVEIERRLDKGTPAEATGRGVEDCRVARESRRRRATRRGREGRGARVWLDREFDA